MEFKEVALLFSGLIALLAFGLSIFNYSRTEKVEKAKLYLELRSRYLQIRRQVPDKYFGSTEMPTEEGLDWIHIEQYWYQSFDEWFTTNKLGNSKSIELWEKLFFSRNSINN